MFNFNKRQIKDQNTEPGLSYFKSQIGSSEHHPPTPIATAQRKAEAYKYVQFQRQGIYSGGDCAARY